MLHQRSYLEMQRNQGWDVPEQEFQKTYDASPPPFPDFKYVPDSWAEWRVGIAKVTRVAIPYTVTDIREGDFEGFSTLECVELLAPSALKSLSSVRIGARAFRGFSLLTSVTFSSSVSRNPPLATENLLENSDRVLRPLGGGSEHPIIVLSGRQPATFYSC